MRRHLLLLIFLLSLPFFFVIRFSAAPLLLQVNERATRFYPKQGRTEVALAVRNLAPQTTRARIKLELLDPEDCVRAELQKDENLAVGAQSVVLSLPFDIDDVAQDERLEMTWYRLRYRITPAAASLDPVEGIVSLSEITPDLFELRLASLRQAREGTRHRVSVVASHPLTNLPVKGVQLKGLVEVDTGKEDVELSARAVTDAEGRAVLDFNLPKGITDEETRIKVHGSLGGFVQESDAEIEFDTHARILITTDKTLYQPGQILHLRALVFDPLRRALPNTKATLKIEDERGEEVFSTEMETSRFGVGFADWQIPENAPLGDYNLTVELDEDRFEDSRASHYVKISRYDLPNFAVEAKPDRPYYLPGQNGEVEIRADYLFGQPVMKGRVRVVRERERRWDFRTQKWETDEGETYEGELDAEGRFRVHVDLSKEHATLSELGYAQFLDLQYAAYLTDATTNRTEQRRFALRLSKEPIHLYIIDGGNRQAEGVPLEFYVSTFYPDGTPAECDVEIQTEEGKPYGIRSSDGQPVRYALANRKMLHARTNRYGVAKITGPPVNAMRFGNGSKHINVRLVARDRAGRVGRQGQDFWLSKGLEVRVQTDKTVYRRGEPVRLTLFSSRPDATLLVEVASRNRAIRSTTVRLENGRAALTLPYSKEFDGRLAVIAFAYEPSAEGYDAGYITDARHILYPQDRELKLDVDFEQNTYRPGEEASARLRALASDGRPLESVLGVVVFDKAVEERARTDQEFSSAYGFDNYFSSFWYGSGDIGGITLRDIERLDPVRRRVPDGMDLVAEILLQESDEERYTPARFDLPELEKKQGEVFSSIIAKQFRPVRETLDAHYKGTANYPADGESLRRLLNQTGINLDSLRDPWGMSYRTNFFVDKSMDIIEIKSAGADKRFDTADDFAAAQFGWPYFRRLGEKIDAALENYHARTGRTVRDAATLREELERAGLSDDALRDRWGRPYQFTFGAQETLVSVNIQSPGPNGHFEPEQVSTDDFIVWTNWTDSFADMKTAIANALEDYLKTTSRFPQNEAQFAELLTRAGIERQSLRDPWGRTYLVNFQSVSRLTARAFMETVGRYGEKPKESLTVTPMSERVYTVRLLSLGEDGRGTTDDDFTAATFTSVGGEGADSTQRRARQAYVFSGSSGAINGVVTDMMGAVVPGAEVLAIHKYTSLDFSIRTDDEGRFTLLNLPSGYYTLTVDVPGFQRYVITDLPVTTARLTKLDIPLDIANVSATVTVTAGGEATINTTNASIGSETRRGATGQTQMSTPRLREYFPETLVWQPALETDAEGRTELRFKLADNITTWKVSVIGSTVDGMIGTAEKEIRAFQPFFVEHDPPRVLTEGDEIHLPVVLRNYLDKRQTVNLEIKPESWFNMTGANEQSAEVEANDATRAIFKFRAVSSVKDGKQRITARGNDASDAIEKPVTVHPDGEERVATVGRIFSDRAVVNTDIPVDALDGTLGGELKIYPDLMGHVIESIEGIMKRPYGCGEQTISSTYPSLMVLMGYSRNGARPTASIRNKAELYLREGYKRLLTYRTAGGGFSYWGGASAEADIALTAYALRFLLDARSIMEVDEDIIKSAAAWLVQQQNTDGSWARYRSGGTGKQEGDASMTALVARTLARTEREGAKKESAKKESASATEKTVAVALARALSYLEPRLVASRDSYLLASYTLAAFDAGQRERAARALQTLRALARDENEWSYWTVEGSTPFYGWGRAGDVETTALALSALARVERTSAAPATKEMAGQRSATATNDSGVESDNRSLIERGLLFLLKEKDRYGVWYSTQATVNVIDAFIMLLASGETGARAMAEEAEVFVNGTRAASIAIPPGNEQAGPLRLDISRFLSRGGNRVEIRRAGGTLPASVQVISAYYVPWTKALAGDSAAASTTASNALELSVAYDRTEVEIGGVVVCKVSARRRADSRSYGMMLAEIGLPPGADVDRASMERALKEYNVSRYDILPDRLVVYLWPYSGASNFEFRFRPRFGLKAQTAPSVLYDYYNPDARTSLAPTRFVVK